MNRYLTIDDPDGSPVYLHGNDYTRALVKASGLRGIGALRESRGARPNAHGGIDRTKYEDSRIIPLEGWIADSTDDLVWTAFGEISAALLATLDVGPALLKWGEGEAGPEFQRLVKLAGPFDPPVEVGAHKLAYQIQVLAEDPRAYSQTLTSAEGEELSDAGGGITFNAPWPWVFAASGGGTVSIAIGGNRPTPPTYRIYGAITNPQIVILGANSTRIVLEGSVPAGDYLEIDVAARTVLLNGVTNYAQYVDSSLSTWAELPAGDTTNLQLIGASFDASARLDVLARAAWA